MATLLYRHVEAEYIGATLPYTDVQPDRYYAESITWLTDFQIVSGCDTNPSSVPTETPPAQKQPISSTE